MQPNSKGHKQQAQGIDVRNALMSLWKASAAGGKTYSGCGSLVDLRHSRGSACEGGACAWVVLGRHNVATVSASNKSGDAAATGKLHNACS
jgi:hypothetical protein